MSQGDSMRKNGKDQFEKGNLNATETRSINGKEGNQMAET